MFRIEHGSSHIIAPTWGDVLRYGIAGDSVFQWVNFLGWVFIGEL